jgi:hypothetical protein
VSGTGFGASIEKMVKGTVQGAIGTRVSFPSQPCASSVRRREDRVRVEGEPRKIFENTKVDGKPLLASFSPTRRGASSTP